MKKTPLVFLHGFPFNSSCWDKQVEHFSEHKIFAPDLRGHRQGPTGPGPWFIHDFSADLKQLLDQSGVDRVVLCGLSMGGYVALHFAKEHPERVAGLVLCDTRADADGNEAKDKRHATARKIESEGLDQFAEEFSKNVLAEMHRTSSLQKKLAGMIRGNKPAAVALSLGALASRRDSTEFLPGVTCPTLVLVGDQDKITPPALSQVLADKIPGAVMHVIRGAGHLSNMEEPEEFNRRIEEFLRRLN